MKVQIFSDCVKEGKNPEILFWVGCSGSFDERAKKITKAFVKKICVKNIGKNFILFLLIIKYN